MNCGSLNGRPPRHPPPECKAAGHGSRSLEATLAYDNGTLQPLGTSLAGFVIGTATVDATGAWVIDLILTSASDPRNPTAANTFVIRPNRIRVTSPLGGRNTATIHPK